MRSRVTRKSSPTSSSVRSRPSLFNPNLRRMTFSSLGLRVWSTSPATSRRLAVITLSAGLAVALSSIRSPNWESPPSPIGVSSEIGCWVSFKALFTLSIEVPIRFAISSVVGSRPRSLTSSREAVLTLLSSSIMCTGTRMVRPWSAIALVIAWRIHQVA